MPVLCQLYWYTNDYAKVQTDNNDDVPATAAKNELIKLCCSGVISSCQFSNACLKCHILNKSKLQKEN